MVSKATNMVLGSGTKNVLAIKLKILMEKQYSHKTCAFFTKTFLILAWSVLTVDSFIALFCFVIWRILQLQLPKQILFLEWMCFLQYVICSDRKGGVYIFKIDRTSNIQNISNNMFWSKLRCVHLHNGAFFSACIFSNISLVQVF